MAEGKCGDPEKGFYVKSCLSVCSCWVCQIIETPGWHGWVSELAHNEGDVPQLLPVSDTSLNQEWREKLTLLENKSLLSRQMWACVCVHACALVWVHQRLWIIGLKSFYTQTVYGILSCRHAQFLSCQWVWSRLKPCGQSVWTLCLSVRPPFLTHFSSWFLLRLFEWENMLIK